MRFTHSPFAAAVAAVAALGLTAAATPAQETEGAEDAPAAARVVLEIRGLHYDAGSEVNVRISAHNEGESAVDNPLVNPLAGGFVLIDADGTEHEPREAGSKQGALQPQRLAPGAYFGAVVDIARHFPELETTGKYTLVYRGDGDESNRVTLNIIEAYNSEADYTALIKTGLGNLELELFDDAAPLTVRNFVDLARQGFYDGLTFHYVRPGDMIIGGDPNGDGTGGSGFFVPAEFSSRQHLAGTVGMVRTSNPDSASSQFYICLAPRPERDGRFTVFGQVVDGFDTLQKMAQVPTSGTDERPYFRPEEPLVIESVTITETREEARDAAEDGDASS